MNIRNCILILATIVLTTSCGEYWEGGDPIPAREMTLSRHVINLMVGDKYHIPVTFTPDEVSNREVWWQTGDSEIAEMDNDSILGVTEGSTKAYAMSVSDRLQDSCLVNVLPKFYIPPTQYPYDMVIYARVTILGKEYTKADEDSIIVAAYINEELRGIGKMREWNNIPYMEIRIWHDVPEDIEPVTLTCYWRGQARMQDFDDFFQFDGQTHGSLSDLYPLVIDQIDDDDEIIDPIIIDLPD